MNNDAISFAKTFNKKYGEFVYSGECALEVALSALDVKGKKVLVANNICHRVVLAIIRCGGIPLIAKPSNSIILTLEDVKDILKKHNDLYCFIAVHQYGIYANIESIKEEFPSLKIIEDIAQSWSIKNIGKFSEFVITSFGDSKQLRLGIGGGIFSNSQDFMDYLDYDCKSSRQKQQIILPYVLPKYIKVKFAKLKKIADKNIKVQKSRATKFKKLINDKFNMLEHFRLCEGVFNRFPVWSKNKQDIDEFAEYLKRNNIAYEKPHKIEMQQLEFLKNQKYYYCDLENEASYVVLLKTRFYK